ncbi:MAG TPA: decaprenyl-phosphate phosphoribosyltransferase [Solirubrobacteraceae bacterium]|nr:decaprenyl-phosphate phosphoribosyltransferase [Solirubrobacteraceae bacterium]
MSIEAVHGTNPAARGHQQLWALVRACRPRQWSKNLLVLAAPGAAGILGRPDIPGKLAVAFASFCMISSATYLFNDLRDRAEDRLNPRRRERPLASGALGVRLAATAALVLALGGLALAAYLRWELAAVATGYLLLTGSYTLWLRRIAVADIVAIAGGFVLRAAAGGAATDVAVSRWFMLVTSFGALFVVAGKRYAELCQREADGESPHRQPGELVRASLHEYSAQYLRFVVALAATVTTTAYCLWAFQRAHHARLSWYELTIVPFVLWLLRYALLLDRGDGHSPEEVILDDGFLRVMTVIWLATFVCGVYVAG